MTTKTRAPRIRNPIPPARADLLPETRQLLAEWLDWAESGAPKHAILWAGAGLCHNLDCLAYTRFDLGTDKRVEDDLKSVFGVNAYPFGGLTRYTYECRHRTVHKNKPRLAWVRANLPEED